MNVPTLDPLDIQRELCLITNHFSVQKGRLEPLGRDHEETGHS